MKYGGHMNKKGSPQNLTMAGCLKKGDPRTLEIAAKGRKARSEKAKARRTFKENINTILSVTMKKGTMITSEEVKNLAEAKNLNVSAETAIVIAMVQRAILGDVNAATWIRDTVGEKPSDKVQVDQSLTVEEWAKNHKVKL